MERFTEEIISEVERKLSKCGCKNTKAHSMSLNSSHV